MEQQAQTKIPQLIPQAITERRFWYCKVFIALEIVKYSNNREMCFLGSSYNKLDNIRYINASFIDILFKYLGIKTSQEIQDNSKIANPYHFLSHKKNYNMYNSLAIVDWSKCPHKAFSFAPKERKKQTDVFKRLLDILLVDMEGGFDLDGNQDYQRVYDKKQGKRIKKKIDLEISEEECIERALKEAKKIIELFNSYHICWWIQFSGTKGLHIRYKVPLDLPFLQKLDLVNLIMEKVYSILNLKTVDHVKFNARKVFKTPYSIVTKNNITRVVLPLDDNQLENFSLTDVEVKNVYKNKEMKLKNRGVIWRNTNINKDERINKFKEFLKDFDIKIPEERKWELN